MHEIFNKSKEMNFLSILIILSIFLIAAGCLSSSTVNSSEKFIHSNDGPYRITAIASLGSSGLALRSDGKILCWGYNYEGFCESPSNLTGVKSISNMNFAVRENGTVAGWGDPALHPGVPQNLTHVVAITRSQYYNIALRDDGTVGWMTNPEWKNAVSDIQSAKIMNQSELTSISGNLGLKKDGTVVTWYVDEKLQTPPLQELSNIIAISNQGEYYAALRGDGTVVAWKVVGFDRPNAGMVIPGHTVKGLSAVRAIAAGPDNLALKRDGTVVSWSNETIESTGITDIAAISTDGYLNLALKNDGSIVAWGNDNKYGELFTPGNLSNIRAISSGFSHTIVLRNDGTIVTWGPGLDMLPQILGKEPNGIRNVTGILANGYQNLILENNDTIYGWGAEEFGPYPVKRIPHQYLALFSGGNALFALKNGNLVKLTVNLSDFNISRELDNVTDVSSRMGYHGIALKNDGTVVVWGGNSTGQNAVPAHLSGVVAVSSGLHRDLALKKDGTVVAWGDNLAGELNIPPDLSDVSAISAGAGFSLALKRDGTVVAWGKNMAGDCNVPENLHDVVAISAGGEQSLALKKDGTVVAWGQTVIPDWNA